MFKRCLIFVVLLAGVGCAWGQDDWKWATVSSERPNINYDDLTWTSWSGSRTYTLYGKIYVVKPGEKADLNVRIIKNGGANLSVTIIKEGRPYPRQWLFVNSREEANLSIRFVNKDENFSVRFMSMKEWEEWWSGVWWWP